MVLFAVVAAIWGAVIWRAFFWNGPAVADRQLADPLAIPDISSQPVRDSFSLSLDYRDPFLGGIPRLNATRNQAIVDAAAPKASAAPASPPVKPVVAKPQTHFRYHGEVRESKSGRRTGLLTADSKMMYVDEGVAYTGFQVLQIWQDSIMIKTEEATFTLRM